MPVLWRKSTLAVIGELLCKPFRTAEFAAKVQVMLGGRAAAAPAIRLRSAAGRDRFTVKNSRKNAKN